MSNYNKKEQTESPETDDLLWGINTIIEALQQNPRAISEVSVQKGKAGQRIQQLIELARSANVKVRFVDPARLGVLRNCNHQGVVARQAPVAFMPLGELLDHCVADQKEMSRILVLDSIQDPRNLGSILRSALSAGFYHVIISRERSAPVSGTVARTSAGALAHMHLCQVANIKETLVRIQEKGFWVFGAVVDQDALSVYQGDFIGQVCLVMGSEGKGIRPLVKKQCDHLVTIPMYSSFNSLNVSVASAIIMFEIARQQAG